MHISVLLNECIENLNIKEDSVIVDCTLGYGGHSSEILKRIPNGRLYGFDQDEFAVEKSNEKLSTISNCLSHPADSAKICLHVLHPSEYGETGKILANNI